jgi:hypothetical protein
MLFSLYNLLCEKTPTTEGEQFGLPVSQNSPLWLAIDHRAYPALLVPAKEAALRPDIVLRAVDVEFSRQFEIQTTGDETQSGCYSVIRLKEDDRDIVRLFMKILEELFHHTDSAFTNAKIAEKIQEIAALFSKLSGGPRDLVGLWGEIFAISQSTKPDAAARSWSTRKKAKYDFVTEGYVLDVKTSLSNVPKHRFSMEQLRPSGDYAAYIFSLCVEEVPSGKSVGEMIDTVAAKLTDPELRTAFLRQCIAKGGKDVYQSTLQLQAYPDSTGYRIFDASNIPVPSVLQSDPIDNVKFDVDLSGVEPLPDKKAVDLMSFSSKGSADGS